MKKINIWKPIMLMTLLFGAMSAAWAEDRFYIDAVNIEPGETKTLAFNLDNSQEFYGFQADISLPEGVEIVKTNGKPDVELSARADDSYSVVTNMLSSGAIRLGTFSTSHSPIIGNSGALLYMKISANTNFTGGTLSIKDILFIDVNDRDVQLPDYNMELGNVHNNQFYIPDFRIDVGETKTVTLVLDNETAFSAFQTDLYVPEDLTIIPNSFVLSSRASNNHTVSSMSYGDGRTRLVCFSTDSSVFSGYSGALLSFEITTGKVMNESCQIELKNQIFSMADAKEYLLPNSVTNVSIGRTLVESVKLNKNELTLVSGDSENLTVTVLPLDALTKEVDWSSDNPDIASVSSNGLVTAAAVGSATIKATAVDGSGKFDECVVTVTPLPVKEITLNQPTITLEAGKSFELTYRILPEEATNKSVIWSTDNDAVASVSENGIVTAINIGTAHVTATAADGFGAKAICTVDVIPLEGEITAGDLNGDGVINILDLNKMIYFFTTDDDTDIIVDAADVTGDGIVNILDINYLINLITNN